MIPPCGGCGRQTVERDDRHLCAQCASLTTPPAVRLGKHERAILLACWDVICTTQAQRWWSDADCYTDALVGAVFGLVGRKDSHVSYRNQPALRYHWRDAAARNRAQATLSRAIRTLYRKGLLDCGSRYEASGHNTSRKREYIKTLRLTRVGALVAAHIVETLRLRGAFES